MYTLDYKLISRKDIPEVGGKNASLGELYQFSDELGILVPLGFCITAKAYDDFVEENNFRSLIEQELKKLSDLPNSIPEVASKIQFLILKGNLSENFKSEINHSFEKIKLSLNPNVSFAIRSSATTEDLPGASFAGLHDTFLNIKTIDEILESIKKCYASLYNARAIKYRIEKGFSDYKISQSISIQQMIRSDLGSSGVCFTIDPETGFKNSIVITGTWGIGESLVQGTIDPDEWHVFKPTLSNAKSSIIHKKLGQKQSTTSINSTQTGISFIKTIKSKQNEYCLSDEEVHQLAKMALKIENHYSTAMDIEWAKDGTDDKIYIVQARPETVQQDKKTQNFQEYKILKKGKIIINGKAVGKGIINGKARIIKDIKEGYKLQEGEILVTEFTSPDWNIWLKKAGAIITNRGGRTSHAAIIAREYGKLALVGASNATQLINDSSEISLDNTLGENGAVYEGFSNWEIKSTPIINLELPETKPMLLLSDSSLAYQFSFLPNKGIGLMRLEFVIQNNIGIHPLALINTSEIPNIELRKKINSLTENYASNREFFIQNLCLGIAKTAAAFFPKLVVVRFSDFKSNEYSNLLGGEYFEPKEENPMLGFRGSFRYYHKIYKEGFKLECEAIKRVREDYNLVNVAIMIPFCRTLKDAENVCNELKKNGLVKGENGLKIYMMMEIPSNVILAKEFAKFFNGFSIGSNDLAQLTLGIDRDSALVSEIGNENDEAVLKLIQLGIKSANEAGVEIGLCGQAASDFKEVIKFLIKNKIGSISFNPDSIIEGINIMRESEKELKAIIVNV